MLPGSLLETIAAAAEAAERQRQQAEAFRAMREDAARTGIGWVVVSFDPATGEATYKRVDPIERINAAMELELMQLQAMLAQRFESGPAADCVEPSTQHVFPNPFPRTIGAEAVPRCRWRPLQTASSYG